MNFAFAIMTYWSIFGISEQLLSAKTDNPLCTIYALNIIAGNSSQYSKKVIHEFYERIIASESIRSRLIILAIQNSKTVDDTVIMMLVNRWKKDGLLECLEVLYHVREKWWHNDLLRGAIIAVVNDRYSVFRTAKINEISKDDLREYCRMILCYSYCRCSVCSITVYGLLQDKRVAIDFTYYPGQGHQVPIPSRVCDYAMMSLLILHQVDIQTISREYGYPLIFQDRQNSSPQKYVEAAFDKMIADIKVIKGRFFK